MNLKNWTLFQKTSIFAAKNGLWGKLLVCQGKKYKKFDFGHFQAFHSTKITTKTSNGHLIFCFQDRMLKFCMKAYLTNLNPWLRGIFDIPTFSFFGIVYSTLFHGFGQSWEHWYPITINARRLLFLIRPSPGKSSTLGFMFLQGGVPVLILPYMKRYLLTELFIRQIWSHDLNPSYCWNLKDRLIIT